MTEFLYPEKRAPNTAPSNLSVTQKDRFIAGLPYEGTQSACVHFILHTDALIDMHSQESGTPYEVAVVLPNGENILDKKTAIRAFFYTVSSTLVRTNTVFTRVGVRPYNSLMKRTDAAYYASAMQQAIHDMQVQPDKNTKFSRSIVHCVLYPALGEDGFSLGPDVGVSLDIPGLQFSAQVIEAYRSFKQASSTSTAAAPETLSAAAEIAAPKGQPIRDYDTNWDKQFDHTKMRPN